MQFIAKAYRTIQQRAWPSLCHLCDQWHSGAICQDCRAKYMLPCQRCERCALPCSTAVCVVCLDEPPLWQQCAAALPYGEPWRSLIAGFKFKQELGLLRIWGACLRQQASDKALLRQADWVFPVPLSRERLRERGFNQSLVLAQTLKHPQLLPEGLLRLRHTVAQASLPRQERLHNLTHAIACNPCHVQSLRGSRVLLVDDVMTTGSTLKACTQALLNAGVKQVDVLVLARADGRQAPQSGLSP